MQCVIKQPCNGLFASLYTILKKRGERRDGGRIFAFDLKKKIQNKHKVVIYSFIWSDNDRKYTPLIHSENQKIFQLIFINKITS